MDIPDNDERPVPGPDGPDPTKMTPALGHLMLHDARTPEEQRAAAQKEWDRRKGRGRARWWEKGE